LMSNPQAGCKLLQTPGPFNKSANAKLLLLSSNQQAGSTAANSCQLLGHSMSVLAFDVQPAGRLNCCKLLQTPGPFNKSANAKLLLLSSNQQAGSTAANSCQLLSHSTSPLNSCRPTTRQAQLLQTPANSSNSSNFSNSCELLRTPHTSAKSSNF